MQKDHNMEEGVESKNHEILFEMLELPPTAGHHIINCRYFPKIMKMIYKNSLSLSTTRRQKATLCLFWVKGKGLHVGTFNMSNFPHND